MPGSVALFLFHTRIQGCIVAETRRQAGRESLHLERAPIRPINLKSLLDLIGRFLLETEHLCAGFEGLVDEITDSGPT